MAKKQLTVVSSPEATAAYAWLSRPDEGQEFSDGKYKVTLVLDKGDSAVEQFIADLEDKANASLEKEFGKVSKNARMPFKDGDDSGKEEFEGKWMLVAKTKFQPGFIGTDKKPLEEDNYPASGDLIRASFALTPYKIGGGVGVSAQLRNVMLIEKRNNGSSADDFADVKASEKAQEEELNDEDFDL
jgi:hypothetical protein